MKHGEKILVRDDEKEKWEERIFISVTKKAKVLCVFEADELEFENDKSFHVRSWNMFKPISQKYDPAEMIGKTVRHKDKTKISIIISVDERGMQTVDDSCDWDYFDEIFEIIK